MSVLSTDVPELAPGGAPAEAGDGRDRAGRDGDKSLAPQDSDGDTIRDDRGVAGSPSHGVRHGRFRGLEALPSLGEGGVGDGDGDRDRGSGDLMGSDGASMGVPYSPPFRFLPTTPPQSLYPRSASSSGLSAEDSDFYPARNDRAHSADRYKGNTIIRNQYAEDCYGDHQYEDRSGESSETRSAKRSAKRRAAGRSRHRSASARGGTEGRRRHGARGGKKRDGARGETEGEDTDGEGGGGEDDDDGSGRVAQITEGLLWVQKHPVLAAVVWMFGKVLTQVSDISDSTPKEPGTEGTEGGAATSSPERDSQTPKAHPCSPDDGGEELGNTREAAGAVDGDDGGERGPRKVGECEGPLWGQPSGNFEEGRPVPTGFWRQSSKGRLSWSDEYGGCLAEYYEDERVRSTSDSSSIKAVASDTTLSYTALPSSTMDSTNGAPSPPLSAVSIPDGRRTFSRNPTSFSNGAGGGGPVSGPPGDFSGMYRGGNGVDGSVEGVVGGCGTLVQNDTFYGDTRGVRGLRRTARNEPGGAANGAAGGEEGAPSDGGEDDGGFLPHTSSAAGTSGAMAGLSAGAPSSTGGAGTWSPQWGWYVTMTPPQDMYPAPPNPVPTAKPATGTSCENAEGSSSLKGRPPRP